MTDILYHIEQENKIQSIVKAENYTNRQALENNMANGKFLPSNALKSLPVLLDDFAYQDMLDYITYGKTSVKYCYKSKIPEENCISLNSSTKDGKEHLYYGGIVMCGNSNICKVCARESAKQYEKDINAILKQSNDDGKYCVMATFTVPHKFGESLDFLNKLLSNSYKKFKNSQLFKKWKKKTGWFNDIRVHEITHGDNGWHSHYHVLYIFDNLIPEEELKKDLFAMYERAFKNVNTNKKLSIESFEISLGSWEEAAGYMTKWGIAQELTQEQHKTEKKGYDIWELIKRAYAGEKLAKFLVNEYIEAMKNKRKVVIGDGLRAYAGIQEADKKDKEAAHKKEIKFTASQWYAILWQKARSSFKQRYKESKEAALIYLNEITEKYLINHPYTDTRWNVKNKGPCLPLYNLPDKDILQ